MAKTLSGAKNLKELVLMATLLSSSCSIDTQGKGRKRPPRSSPSPPPPTPTPSPPPPPPAPSPPPPGLGNFDHYVLALQWAISYCKETGRNVHYCSSTDYNRFPKYFTIHGLWPTNVGGRPPLVQSKQKFDIKELQPAHSQLISEWPDAKSYNPAQQAKVVDYQGFWQYEWDKHGTATSCSSQLGYFQLTLRLHYRVKQFLTPYRRGSLVDINSLKQFLQKNLGGMPEVICSYSGNQEQITF